MPKTFSKKWLAQAGTLTPFAAPFPVVYAKNGETWARVEIIS